MSLDNVVNNCPIIRLSRENTGFAVSSGDKVFKTIGPSHIKIMLGSSRLTAYHIFAISMFNVLILFFR